MRIAKWLVPLISLFGIGSVWMLWMAAGELLQKGKETTADGTNEYAIVLGAKVNGTTPSLSLQYRLDAAFAYAEEHPNVKLVLTGGQGRDEAISEAEAMESQLIERGISKERLLTEHQSTSTYENLKYALPLLPESVDTVTIITSDYHVARARYIAEQLGLKTDAVAAKTPKSVEAKSHVRERLAVMKTLLLKK